MLTLQCIGPLLVTAIKPPFTPEGGHPTDSANLLKNQGAYAPRSPLSMRTGMAGRAVRILDAGRC